MRTTVSKSCAPGSAKTQRARILERLTEAAGDWVPSPEIASFAQQYGARVYELRRAGFVIENRARTDETTGERHSWFRLVCESPAASPIPVAGRDWYPDRPTGLPLFDPPVAHK